MKVMIIHSGSLNSFPGGEKQVALSDKKWLEKTQIIFIERILDF